ncbi:MAG: hypothetical protein Q8916_08395 [Bacteroidota bacterium]|nr:hypothetical protein [Bacteroidota bacterium]MDP4235815.1 hypothetical protein [Bacteroidota bacterium]
MNALSLSLTSGSLWLFFLALLAGFGLSVWTYRRTVPKTTPVRRRILITLRSLGLALLLFVLFQPVLTLTKTSELTPHIALALDNSKSMRLPEAGTDTASSKNRRTAMLANVTEVIGANVLSNPEKLNTYFFSEQTEALGGTPPHSFDSLKADASVTDISSIFSYLQNEEKTKNIGAIVLYSDGAYTGGSNPVYSAEKLGIPVYAVGLGDSTEIRDIALSEIFTNEVATINVSQPVDVTIHSVGAKSGDRVTVSLFAEGEKIGEEPLSLKEGTGDNTLTFTFTPKKEGTVKLTAKVTPSDPASNATEKNDLRISYVNVLKNKFRIVLFAGSPSSDVSFIREYFEGRKEIEFVSYVQKQGAEFYEGNPTEEKVRDADLVILIGFPISSTSNESLALVRKLLVGQSRPMLFIPSRMLDLDKLRTLEDAMPFSLKNARPSNNELKVSTALEPDKKDNPIFRAKSEQTSQTKWESLAPLIKTETHFVAKPESEVLAEATLQGVKLGDPLVISRTIGRSRQVAFTGYGLWQWKLTSFGREKAFASLSRKKDSTAASESALDIFLGNATRWLVTHDDQKRVRIAPTRKLYDAGEKIEFSGQIYDESFLPVDGAIVTLKVMGVKLSSPMELTLEPLSNGRYSAKLLQGLAAGDYTYSGEAKLDGKILGTDGGRFNVGDYSPEFAEPRMRSDILRDLAERTGGKFYTPQTASTLMKDIEASSNFHAKKFEEKKDYEGRNMWPLLVLAVMFFSTEWFIRKRTGML